MAGRARTLTIVPQGEGTERPSPRPSVVPVPLRRPREGGDHEATSSRSQLDGATSPNRGFRGTSTAGANAGPSRFEVPACAGTTEEGRAGHVQRGDAGPMDRKRDHAVGSDGALVPLPGDLNEPPITPSLSRPHPQRRVRPFSWIPCSPNPRPDHPPIFPVPLPDLTDQTGLRLLDCFQRCNRRYSISQPADAVHAVPQRELIARLAARWDEEISGRAAAQPQINHVSLLNAGQLRVGSNRRPSLPADFGALPDPHRLQPLSSAIRTLRTASFAGPLHVIQLAPLDRPGPAAWE